MVNTLRPTDSLLGKKPEISEETQVILKNAYSSKILKTVIPGNRCIKSHLNTQPQIASFYSVKIYNSAKTPGGPLYCLFCNAQSSCEYGWLEVQCVDKPTRCNTSYGWSLLSINWLYMFQTITSPSSGASSHKLYNASLAVAWMYIHGTARLALYSLWDDAPDDGLVIVRNM